MHWTGQRERGERAIYTEARTLHGGFISHNVKTLRWIEDERPRPARPFSSILTERISNNNLWHKHRFPTATASRVFSAPCCPHGKNEQRGNLKVTKQALKMTHLPPKAKELKSMNRLPGSEPSQLTQPLVRRRRAFFPWWPQILPHFMLQRFSLYPHERMPGKYEQGSAEVCRD